MTAISYSNEDTSLAQYSIDDGSIIEFQVANGTSIAHYNLISFQTPILSPGSHRLFVQYGANNPDNAAPLRLDKFVIQNLTFPSLSKLVTLSSLVFEGHCYAWQYESFFFFVLLRFVYLFYFS